MFANIIVNITYHDHFLSTINFWNYFFKDSYILNAKYKANNSIAYGVT